MVHKYSGHDIVELHILYELGNLKEENEYLRKCITENSEKRRCAVCGEIIQNLSVQRMTRPALWHDRKCFTYKPRKIIALEQLYGCDIVEILKETTRQCGNIKVQCQMLGVSIPYFYSIIRKYTGKNLIEFMAEYSVGKRKDLYEKKIQKDTKSSKSNR